jgi:hypothetical protein
MKKQRKFRKFCYFRCVKVSAILSSNLSDKEELVVFIVNEHSPHFC